MSRERLGALVRVLISIGLLGLLVRQKGVDLATVMNLLKTARPLPLLGAAIIYMVGGSVVRGFRWQALINSLGHHVSARRATSLFVIGTLFNQFMPTGIGGDVVRMVMLARDGVGRAHAASTVLVDRAIGILMVLWPALAILALAPNRTSPTLTLILLGAGLAGLVGGLMLILGERWRPQAARLPLLGRVFLHPGVGRFLDSFGQYGRRALLASSGWSMLFTLVLIFSNALLGRALGIESATLLDWSIVVPLVALSTMLPLSMAGWGVREVTYVGLLGQLPVPVAHDPAFAISVVFGIMNAGLAAIGALLLARSGERAAGVLDADAATQAEDLRIPPP